MFTVKLICCKNSAGNDETVLPVRRLGMCVTPSVVFGVYCTSGSRTPGVCEVVSGGDGSGPAHDGVAHALGHSAATHPHGGAHVGGAHRGHGGSHAVVGRVERLHWRPATAHWGWWQHSQYRSPIRLEYKILVTIYSVVIYNVQLFFRPSPFLFALCV